MQPSPQSSGTTHLHPTLGVTAADRSSHPESGYRSCQRQHSTSRWGRPRKVHATRARPGTAPHDRPAPPPHVVVCERTGRVPRRTDARFQPREGPSTSSPCDGPPSTRRALDLAMCAETTRPIAGAPTGAPATRPRTKKIDPKLRGCDAQAFPSVFLEHELLEEVRARDDQVAESDRWEAEVDSPRLLRRPGKVDPR